MRTNTVVVAKSEIRGEVRKGNKKAPTFEGAFRDQDGKCSAYTVDDVGKCYAIPTLTYNTVFQEKW
jgi:hypothetical protein